MLGSKSFKLSSLALKPEIGWTKSLVKKATGNSERKKYFVDAYRTRHLKKMKGGN